MNIKNLNKLIDRYGVEDVEKHLIYSFIICNKVSLNGCVFFQNYFAEFEPSDEILSFVKCNKFNFKELTIYLELLIPEKDKGINGTFFTPDYIAHYIINEISPTSNARILDPSCGCGAFLLSAADYFMSNFPKSLKEVVSENLYGVDILEYNIKRTKILFVLKGLMQGEILEDADFQLECNDSLKKIWLDKFDAVIGNPPYVKYQDLDNDNRDFLLKNWRTTKKGTFNLYFPFFELGYSLLTETGKLGYITPNNYFTSLAGEPLRLFFQELRNIYKIVDFNSTRVFDVQTYTAITFLDKAKNTDISYCRIPKNTIPLQFIQDIQEIDFTPNEYNELSHKKWRLLCGNESVNIKRIETIGKPLKELFNICVGIATLKDEVYFVDPINELETTYSFYKYGQLHSIEKSITKPLVKISDVKSQEDIAKNNRRIIFPYKVLNGKSSIIEEAEIKKAYPLCYEYLLSVRNILKSRDKGKNSFSPFYAYGRTQGLTKQGIRIYTPTFSQTPRFLVDNNEEALFTNGYALYFYPRVDIHKITSPENIQIVQKILNSAVMEYYVSRTSVSIEGGYPCYQKNFIENFTIPDLSQDDIEFLKSTNDTEKINRFLESKYQINLLSPNRC